MLFRLILDGLSGLFRERLGMQMMPFRLMLDILCELFGEMLGTLWKLYYLD